MTTRNYIQTFEITTDSDLRASRVELRNLAQEYKFSLQVQARLFWALTHVGNLMLTLGEYGAIDVFYLQDDDNEDRLGLQVNYTGSGSDRLERMCKRWFDETELTFTDEPHLSMSIWST